MKINALFATLTLVFAAFTLNAQQTIPDVTVKTLDGHIVNLQESYANNGKITILSFWATWCKPCQKELDAIADLYPDWQEMYDVEVVAITIDTQRGLAKVPPMVETKGWEYTILAGNDQDLMNAFNFTTIPNTVVIGKDGNIAFTHNGYSAGYEYELEDKLAKLAEK
jgi:cytochrome c biogenesis protein CcmG/thiol:disulfide interchange protein DsbE